MPMPSLPSPTSALALRLRLTLIPVRAASRFATMKPTLCRLRAYSAPGLPSPTIIHIRHSHDRKTRAYPVPGTPLSQVRTSGSGLGWRRFLGGGLGCALGLLLALSGRGLSGLALKLLGGRRHR